MSDDDVIEHAHQLLAPKIQYIRQLKTALEAETRLKQRVKDIQTDRSYAAGDDVQAALDAAGSAAQQALDAAKETTKSARKSALTEGGWSRQDLTELGLIPTRKRRAKTSGTTEEQDFNFHGSDTAAPDTDQTGGEASTPHESTI